MIKIQIICVFCKKEHTVTASKIGVKKWQSGMFIQDALPELSADDRELLISRTCPKCWNETFGKE